MESSTVERRIGRVTPSLQCRHVLIVSEGVSDRAHSMEERAIRRWEKLVSQGLLWYERSTSAARLRVPLSSEEVAGLVAVGEA